ncbi:sensor histidine kinase [Peredibacter starrii]|uniref:histidine kinase n=1 Tax=Peredibacter starrii TaxID=28202 RepID=A0AAX4HLM1_9BACT|nr:ATP-binding protein [Peredibacter starrii]WPU64070.1 ATP-binding protein [Peredibacter starrii]
MNKLKANFLRALSIGVHPGLDEGKKFAIQVATLDGYWSFFAFFFYAIYTYVEGHTFLFYFFTASSVLTVLGLWLIAKHQFDIARVLIHQVGLYAIFVTADALGVGSGVEYYYFTSVLVPHIVFSLEELWKGAILSASTCVVFIAQHILGSGLLLSAIPSTGNDKLIAIIFVLSFTLSVLTVARWRLLHAQREITRQQGELIHSSNLVALGEMTGGIAHEINNPLQSLTLQVTVLKDKLKGLDVEEHLNSIDETIFKMGKMVQGLKDLSRKDTEDPPERFPFSKVLDDVLAISSERLNHLDIMVSVQGNTSHIIKGHSVQISQVLLNLLNNSTDAIQSLPDRWIWINVQKKSSFLQISVVDSGRGIKDEVAARMMNPFFTTKEPSKGTGLGLSISKSIIERNNGSLFYDPAHFNTRFVILLPLV